MKLHQRILASLLAAVLLASLPEVAQAKGYSSSGGHSYSSHSSSSHSSGSSGSHSSGFGGSSRSSSGSSTRSSGSKTFNSGSGKSYSSGSTSSDSNRKSYNSAKSYSSSDGKRFSSAPRKESTSSAPNSSGSGKNDSGGFAFDTAAARARKQETSKEQFSQYKQSQNPAPADGSRSAPGADSYRGQPPPIVTPGGRPSRPGLYIPDYTTISTRPVRIYNVYHSYGWRPWVSYHDPYGSLFWWWLLDRSLDDRAWWAYHHRYDMDPARYEALVATDAQLQARVAQLEAQQVGRDPGYVPPGLDGRDLMYSDHYVNRAYSNRPTTFGVISFWVFGIPLALGFCAFFIWLIWFKRWQTST